MGQWMPPYYGVESLDAYWIMFGWVFLGEFVVICAVGYPLFFILIKKIDKISKGLVLIRNLDFKW